MTDQIYYKVQYPLKKAINTVKAVEDNEPFGGKSYDQISDSEILEIKEFLEQWETEGKEKIKSLIRDLRKIQ